MNMTGRRTLKNKNSFGVNIDHDGASIRNTGAIIVNNFSWVILWRGHFHKGLLKLIIVCIVIISSLLGYL